jgi:hypothetical protein
MVDETPNRAGCESLASGRAEPGQYQRKLGYGCAGESPTEGGRRGLERLG